MKNSSGNAANFTEKTKAKLCAARYEARRLIGKQSDVNLAGIFASTLFLESLILAQNERWRRG